MPFLTDDELEDLVSRAVKKALRGDPEAANREAVSELVASGEETGDRQAGRHTGGGFHAAAQKVTAESDRRRNEFNEHVRNHGYER